MSQGVEHMRARCPPNDSAATLFKERSVSYAKPQRQRTELIITIVDRLSRSRPRILVRAGSFCITITTKDLAMLLRLTSKTNKAKSRLNQIAESLPGWDGLWNVTESRQSVAFDPQPGPWHHCHPRVIEGFQPVRYTRWVHDQTDEHFDIVERSQD